jgi:arylsulfatase A-like enzyme
VLAAIKSVDSDLATVLESLEAKKVRDKTDVFVVSDHGFSTVERSVNVAALLNAAGFKAATEFRNKPVAGDIMVVANGGAVLFYVIGHDEAVTRRLVEWLQRSDFAGVIFSREEMEGTFKLKEICIDTTAAPDVVMSFRWKASENQFGVPGLINADWDRAAGKGTHATLSKFDLHNTLIAAGPDFRRGFVDERPTGNIDLAPTILHILGINSPHKFDGRILSEAMTGGGADIPQANTKTMEAERAFSSAKWRQHLRVTKVGDTIYFDEGNAE